MIKIADKPTLYVDVDDTLVMWDKNKAAKDKSFIQLKSGKTKVKVYPHKAHVEIIKQFKARGHNVVVWSQGGANWAEVVVKALKLEDIVDLIVNKPNWFIDDLNSSSFLPDSNRIWVEASIKTKNRVSRIKPSCPDFLKKG